MDGEIASLRRLFQTVKDKRASNASHKLDDILMSGYAMFALKYPSIFSSKFKQILKPKLNCGKVSKLFFTQHP